MSLEYICDSCKTVYRSSAEYSYLKDRECCGFPIWYTEQQVDIMKKYRVDQLKEDYIQYMGDVRDSLV